MDYIRHMKSSTFQSTSYQGRFIRPERSNKTTRSHLIKTVEFN